MDEFLKQQGEEILDIAERNFKRRGRLSPVCIAICPFGRQPLPLDFKDDERKDASFRAAYSLLDIPVVRGIIIVAEAWVVQRPMNLSTMVNPPEPRKATDRQEVVIVTVSDRHTTRAHLLKVHREGEDARLERTEWLENA